MIDSSVKELLQSFTRVNELSKKAIDELCQYLEKNGGSASDENSFIESLQSSVISLNEEAVEAKKIHCKLSISKSKCTEGSASSNITPSNQEIGENTIEDSTDKCIIKSSEELTEKVSNNSTEGDPINTDEISEEASGELDKDQNKCDDELIHSNEDNIKKEVTDKPLLKIVDFKKLVDPRNLELMDKNEKNKEENADVSIIVLSSSDDDETLSNSKLPETSKQNIQISTSGAKPRAHTSYPSKKNMPDSITKKQESIKIGNVIIKSSHKDYMTIKNDIKFTYEPYVMLLRIPCEEMKNFYSRKHKNNRYEKDSKSKSSSNCSDGLECNTEKTAQYSSESDSDKNKKELKNKSKFTKKSKKIEVEGRRPHSVKEKKKFSEQMLKTSSCENSSSSDEEPEEEVSGHEKEDGQKEKFRKGKMNKEDNSKSKKSEYLLSDDEDSENDCQNSVSEVSKEKQNLENSKKSFEKKASNNESSSEDSDNVCEQENGEGQPEKNKSSSRKKKSTDSIVISSLSDDAEDESTKNIKEHSDSDQSSQKKNNSDEQIVINSDDSENSDFENFFTKNRMTRSTKKIKTLISDSEEDTPKEDKTECNENEKESSKSENSSDKEDDDGVVRKRKRIKEIKNDSSDSDEAVTRKKIKKVISKDSLSVKTKKAAAEERERKQRILEKQKKYNQIYESANLANSKVEKLVLDVDEETEQPLLEVDEALVSKLKPHQASGIQFMWDACFESIKRIKTSEGSGCILAHCMGLGKTLQVIALTNTLLETDETNIKKILIVTPLSTVLNWKAEYKNWLTGEESYDVYELASVRAQNSERACYVREWHENGGVMIISYSMFRNLSNEKNRKVGKKLRTTFIEGLVDPGPDLVICDEGHLLKNEKTSLSAAMNKIKTRRRIVLTGTPLQNNLKEYYCMVQFVKPNLLGTYKEYLNRFVNPITNGQYTDSTQYDINVMRRRSHVLHKLLDGIVQRRDYSVLSPYLPPKFEYVLFLTLSETQKKLYSHYMNHFAKKSNDEGSNRTSFLFKDFQALSRICIHPRVLLDKSNDDQLKYQSDDESIGSLKDFIDDDSSSTSSSDSESVQDSKGKRATKRVTRAQKINPAVDSSEEDEIEVKEWWQEYCDGEELDNIAHSTKILLLFEILKECEQIGDKVLLFSQSLYALNLIEYFLEKVDEATQNGNADEKTCGFTGSWSLGLDYFRLDGSTNCSLRADWCNSFNKDSNPRARLFLLSTRAGGLGINLVGANRVILFDVSWNPSSDIQSIYRVYRFGQLKPSYIYRFVMYGTMEMKIYERQVTKQAISKRVIDEQQIDRHYNQNDLAELYKFEEPDMEVRPTPLVPKDVLLGEMLINHDDKIYKYHEHQTLLENKEDETLNEEERKAAWDEFENEKVERTKQPLIGKFSVNTVQLALRSIIQRDNPTWNNSQILSIIPQLIQQLNLQLSIGDQTMYNRIAAEVQVMQEEYARKMQMQFYQYRMQLAQNQHMHNVFQQQFQMMNGLGNRMPPPDIGNLNPRGSNFNPSGSNFNPNEIVELN